MSVIDAFRAFLSLFIAPAIGALAGFLMALHRFLYILARDWNGWNKLILLKDQVIIVTGAVGGFGTATTKLLIDAGAIVYAIDIVDSEVAAERLPKTDRCIYKKLDITDNKALEKFVNELRKKNVQVYAAVQNAGIGGVPCAATQSTPENIRKVFDVNLFAAVELNRLLFDVSDPLFKFSSQKCVAGRAPIRSRIVNISSVAGLVTTANMANYAASKHALESYSDAARIELNESQYGMDVVLVEPYFAATGILRAIVDPKNTFQGSILQEQQLRGRNKFSKALEQNVLMTPEYVATFILRALTEAVPQDRYMVAPPDVEAQVRTIIHWPNYGFLCDKLKNRGQSSDTL
jgi:3-oxoacyl-[acyl-carrier protein] reductase